MGLPWWLSGKESACNAGHTSSIPGSQRSPARGHGNSLQYSCWENTMDRERSLAGYSPPSCKELDVSQSTEHALPLIINK